MEGADVSKGRLSCAAALREKPGKMKWAKEARAWRLPKLPGSCHPSQSQASPTSACSALSEGRRRLS